MDFKKIIAGAFACLSIANVSEAHLISYEQEGYLGKRMYEQYQATHPQVEDVLSIRIQKVIARANSDKLSLIDRDKKQKRWMEPIFSCHDSQLNAFCFPSGYIVVTDTMLDFCRDKSIEKTNIHVIDNSVLGAVISHEMAHYANKDFLNRYDKNEVISTLFGAFLGKHGYEQAQLEAIASDYLHKLMLRDMSFSEEKSADEDGMRYMLNAVFVKNSDINPTVKEWLNHPHLNIGGMPVLFSRTIDYEKKNNIGYNGNVINAHSKTELRLQRSLDFINEISGGRMVVRTDGTFSIDGKEVRNLPKDKEHRFMLAGYIAECFYYKVKDYDKWLVGYDGEEKPENAYLYVKATNPKTGEDGWIFLKSYLSDF